MYVYVIDWSNRWKRLRFKRKSDIKIPCKNCRHKMWVDKALHLSPPQCVRLYIIDFSHGNFQHKCKSEKNHCHNFSVLHSLCWIMCVNKIYNISKESVYIIEKSKSNQIRIKFLLPFSHLAIFVSIKLLIIWLHLFKRNQRPRDWLRNWEKNPTNNGIINKKNANYCNENFHKKREKNIYSFSLPISPNTNTLETISHSFYNVGLYQEDSETR